ncbi:NAD(P)/FAD-dependent oxidoreductase [Fodinicurvata fenggangensis]|uniref:NAD(P)/FAD-dependent oxidoreductase n=1 Tax=Fodinicurvata fenggangensis TaxID=1121830 RepID=UPI000690863A|nr:FAD-dependent oxidoreductase [Fodinicurvata fenggangensis]
MAEPEETIVVGAGVVGAACALQLQREGQQVRLIDRDPPGSGTSSGNAGSISNGSVVPMAIPGMLRQVPAWLLDPQGPLSVRWSYLPKAFPWLVQWLQAARRDRAERYSVALAQLTLDAVEHWQGLLEPAQRDRLIHQKGQLLVSRTREPGAPELFAQVLREARGVVTEAVDDDELRQLEPNLSRDYRRGLLIPDSGHTTNPRALTEALVDLLLAAGGQFTRAEVLEIERSGGQAQAVVTAGGRLPARNVVVAGGAFSLELARPLGDKVPLETERGYHCMLLQPELTLNRPTSDMERKYFATSMEEGLRVAGTVEIAGLEAPPDYSRARRLLQQAKKMLPALDTREHKFWIGYRPSIPDSLPVIDRSRNLGNVWYAFGHGHLGLTMAPATARRMARLLRAPAGRLEENAFRIDRF